MASKKKRLFLVRNDDDNVSLVASVSPPKKEGRKGCSCGNPDCSMNDGEGEVVGPRRYNTAGNFYNFCIDGLAEAGIKIAEGQRLEVKISRVAR